MQHYALIGEKLGHSLSVPIHQAVFERMGIDADYTLIEIPKGKLPEVAPNLMREYDGFNITIPYKKDIIPFLTDIDAFARDMGAVNTVCTKPVPVGHNTDAPGFAAMLRYANIDPAGKPCFVLGTGGASTAVVAALNAMGAASVTLVSRTPGEGIIGYDTLPEVFSGILVNSTPVGMYPKANACPIEKGTLDCMLKKADGVADLIYNPEETLLTAAAKAQGVPAVTGLYMLIAQALEAERYWQGVDIPQDIIPKLMKELKP